jgi:hypothetical protein
MSPRSQSKSLLEMGACVGEQGSPSNPAFLSTVQITGDINAADQTG